jgi:hypothetical protein
MVKDKAGDSFAMLLQGFDRGLFILAHQAAVSLDISAENSGELAFNVSRVHGITPQIQKPPREYEHLSEALFPSPSGNLVSQLPPEG